MRLYCGFIKGEYLDVGLWKYLSAANQSAIILIFKILVYGVMGCCVCYNGLFWERFWLRDVGCLLWFFVIDFTFDWWDSFSCLLVMFCFLGVIDWMVAGIVCCDFLMWLIVPVGCFLLNGCDFVRKKKNKGLTVHCNVAFVKPYVKMSALWFKRLIFWFGRVLFVVKTFSCSERRFASGAS